MSDTNYEPVQLDYDFGNPRDDDGRIIDEMFIEVDNPPDPVATNMITAKSTDKPKVFDRLLTVTQQITAGNPPIQLLPADPLRESNHLSVRWVTNGSGGDALYLADDQGKVFFQSSCFLLTTTLPWEPFGYTGAIWAYQPSTGAGGYVTVIGVTGQKP